MICPICQADLQSQQRDAHGYLFKYECNCFGRAYRCYTGTGYLGKESQITDLSIDMGPLMFRFQVFDVNNPPETYSWVMRMFQKNGSWDVIAKGDDKLTPETCWTLFQRFQKLMVFA